MTKTPERPTNELVDEAQREAARTGQPVCEILKQWRKRASRDKPRLRKIIAAEKYLGCRNKRKRRKQS